MSETGISHGVGAGEAGIPRRLRIFLRVVQDGSLREILHSYDAPQGEDVRESDCDQALELWSREGVEEYDFILALEADRPGQPISVTPDDLNRYVAAFYGF